MATRYRVVPKHWKVFIVERLESCYEGEKWIPVKEPSPPNTLYWYGTVRRFSTKTEAETFILDRLREEELEENRSRQREEFLQRNPPYEFPRPERKM